MKVTSVTQLSICTKTSFDGGVTWGNQKILPHIFSGFTSADVSIAFNSSGTAVISYVDYKLNLDSGYVRTVRSTNGGVSWSAPVNAVSKNDSPDLPIDRPWIVCDNTNGTYSGRLYIVSKSYYAAALPQKIWLSVSADTGKTWTPIKQLDDSIPTGLKNIMGTPTVGADGAFYVAYMSYKPALNPYARVICTKSTDGGSNFTPHDAMHFAANSGSTDTLYQGSYSLSANPINAGNIIFQGTDSRNGDMDILSVFSADGGITWSATPVRVNDDAISNGIAQDMSWGGFSPNGTYAIAWRDRRNGTAPTSDTSAFEIYTALSSNGGTTFLANYKLSSARSPFMNIQRGNDFIGLCMNSSTVFSDWCDKRTGNNEIFFRGELLSQVTSSEEQFEVSYFKFRVFPNPSLKGQWQYEIEGEGFSKGGFQVQIVDISGKEMYSKNLNETQGTVNANLPGGTYFVKFKNEGRVVAVKKIVVM
jgi:Neuraminidase (sialidase)